MTLVYDKTLPWKPARNACDVNVADTSELLKTYF